MIDWHQVKTVFLDMDGTLLDLYFDNYFWRQFVPLKYAHHHELPHDEAHAIMDEKYSAVVGTMNWYCVDYWTDELGLDIEALKHEVSDYIAVHPHVHDFLETLKSSDREVLLVTNAHRKSLDLKMDKTQIDHYFDRIVCSHDYGLPKEDPEFWHRMNNDIPFNKEQTLLVEDSLSVLHSARDYGIKHLLAITRPDSSEEDERVVEDFPAVASFEGILSSDPSA